MKKTLIVFDTNYLMSNSGRGESYNSFEFCFDYFDILNFISRNNLSDKVFLSVPKIVLEELNYRKLYFYGEDRKKIFEKFKNFSKLEQASLNIPHINLYYKNHLNELINEFLEKNNIKIIDYPDNNCFKNVIKRAIEKKKPFIATKNHSDYGFKDVVIWESLLNYSELRDYEKVILMTGDAKAFTDDCISEFESIYDKRMFIFNSKKELTKEIAKDYNIDLEGDEFSVFVNKDYFKSHIENILKTLKPIYKGIKINTLKYHSIDYLHELLEPTDEDQKEVNKIIVSKVNYKVKVNEKFEETMIIIKTYIDDTKGILGNEVIWDEI